MNRWTTLVIAYLTLITACSAAPDDEKSSQSYELPADAAVLLSPVDKGVSRLEARDLGAPFGADSPYQKALGEGNFGEAARRFVTGHAKLFGFGATTPDFRVRSSQSDDLGITVVRLDQYHDELPVFDGELVFYFARGLLERVIGDYSASISLPSNAPANSKRAAFSVAVAAIDGLNDCNACTAQLGVFAPPRSKRRTEPRLVWAVDAGAFDIGRLWTRVASGCSRTLPGETVHAISL